MVTPLDATLISRFNSFFSVLLVLFISYGILTTVKIFKNEFINAMIAFILAIISASSSTVTRTIEIATPWLVLVFGILLFILILVKFMDAEKALALHDNVAIVTVLIIVIVTIFILAAGEVNRQNTEQLVKSGQLQAGQSPVLTFPEKVGEVLRQPSVLGLIAILLIATFAIMLIARPNA